ncbi:uncharacterized protein [Garra rufa]|uniref:uncharacterized protein n=1 Tax=Garra rufa TaxID=137080 RepID=UPI003CCE8A3A
MYNVTKPKRPRYESEIRRDKVRNKTRICIGDAFERWRRLKTEKNLKTDANVAHFLLDRVCGEQDKSSPIPRKRGRPRKTTFVSAPQIEDKAQPERLEDETKPDIRMGYTEEQNWIEHSSSSSTITDEDSTVDWEERKDELAQTALRLEERLNAMRSLSDTASDPISMTRGIVDQKERLVNKSSLTGLFRTCHQCGEPVLEFKTLTSGSLIRIQWECSKGHLMWLFPNHNPT